MAYDMQGSYSLAFTVYLVSFIVAAGLMLLAFQPRKPVALAQA
jgi:hypothetical protein